MSTTGNGFDERKERTFEYLINEYNVLWGYYNKLHDERQRIFENYIKMIGIPITLVGFWFSMPKNDNFDFDKAICFICGLVFVILIIGHIYFYIFAKETYNAVRYANKIREIEEMVCNKGTNYVNVEDITRVFERENKISVSSIKSAKVLIIAIINVVVLGVLFLLLQSCYSEKFISINCKHIAIFCCIDGILQMGFYFWHGFKKNKIEAVTGLKRIKNWVDGGKVKFFEKIKNRMTIYFGTILISIIFVIPACLTEDNVFYNILSSIGCSGIAAALMAIFLDTMDAKQKKNKLIKARKIYFDKLNFELKALLQRILWFDERVEDKDFDWSMPVHKYCTLQYILHSFSSYKSDEIITFSEAVNRLNKCREKYSLDALKQYSQDERAKIEKMFQIISASGHTLLMIVQNINQQKVMLDSEEYITLTDIERLVFNINFAVSLMSISGKNYAVPIKQIVECAEMIRSLCEDNSDFQISLQGSFSANEL